MQLSPTLRTILVIVAIIAGTLTGVGAALGIPAVVISIAGAVTAALAALGIVPPQTGGTQVGVVKPAVVEPPQAAVAEAVPPVDPHVGGRDPGVPGV